MKTWNTPEVKELNINETANGFFRSDIETCILFNDSFNKSDTPKEEEKEPVNQLS